jgi:hypothetical protein
MIHILNNRLIDDSNRTIILHGVNLGGSSKVPAMPNGATHSCEDFFEHKRVSFVGRPFPLAEANEHFRRLAQWGFNFIRLVITWEAIEHEGPGIYDQGYLDYIHSIVTKAGEYGFSVLIDPHQDVWSRWTGGDGAPGWTLEEVGFDLKNLTATCAAIQHQTYGGSMPDMVWFLNATKLATATMFTLFFGGNDFAPQSCIRGVPVQEFLQEHYINSIRQVASRLRDIPCVLGYEPMNEPSRGYIGWKDVTRPMLTYDEGETPSPFQSMLLGMGISQQVGVWRRKLFRAKLSEIKTVNTDAVKAWRDIASCIWLRNEVWDLDSRGEPCLLRPDHFSHVAGRAVDFESDYLLPFVKRFASGIRSEHPGAMIFFEGEPSGGIFELNQGMLENSVYAPHWYDAACLMKKRYMSFFGVDINTKKLVIGRNRVRKSFAEQLKRFTTVSESKLGGMPVIIGELGIPFDLDNGKAFHTGDFSKQIKAMDRSLAAAEQALLGYAIWNYTPDNDNAHGDQWNGEDLSIFSRDRQRGGSDCYAGGRALASVIRPYPVATAGDPMRISFDIKKKIFIYRFRHDPAAEGPTQIYVPEYHYGAGYEVKVSDGTFYFDATHEYLYYRHDPLQGDEHTLTITRGTGKIHT